MADPRDAAGGPATAPALRDLLALFLEPRELEPGLYEVSLTLGEHEVRVRAQQTPEGVTLRCHVLDALPSELAGNPAVQERLHTFGDLVANGSLRQDERGEPVIEVAVGASGAAGQGRAMFMAALESLAADCARLRGAAEGIALAVERGRAPAPAQPAEPAAPPAVAGGTGRARPRGRMWDRLVAGSPELRALRRQRETEPAPAPAAPPAAAPAGAGGVPDETGEKLPEAGGSPSGDELASALELGETVAASHEPAAPLAVPPAAGAEPSSVAPLAPDAAAAPAGPAAAPAPAEPAEPGPAAGGAGAATGDLRLRVSRRAEQYAWALEPEPLPAAAEAEPAPPAPPPQPALASAEPDSPVPVSLPPDAPELLRPTAVERGESSRHFGDRLRREGDELQVLSWMDEVDEPQRPSPRPAASPLAERARLATSRRRAGLAIPEPLLPHLTRLALQWYRDPERTELSGEVREGQECIWVQCDFAPGDRSWRYRQPVLQISRPPVRTALVNYQPEPLELSHQEVEAWLLSEGRIDEGEVERRRRAAELRERSYQLRAEGDADGAVACLDEALGLVPGDATTLTALAHLYRKEFDNPKVALELYNKVLAEKPRFVPARLGRAMILVAKDRHWAAEEAVQALALSPDDPDALELAGLVSLRAGRRARARELFLRLYRQDRRRGEQALLLLEAEREGEAKWDPWLVIWERRALEAGERLDAITRALYEERIQLAEQFDRFLSSYPELSPAERRDELDQLGEAASYTFLSELLRRYQDEPDPEVQRAIERVFLRSPTPGAMALEDALRYALEPDLRTAALRMAATLRWRDLLPAALEAFRRAKLPREIDAFLEDLVRFGGPEVAMALLAKLERGVSECLEALLRMLAQRPDPHAEQAAIALREVLREPGAVALAQGEREALEAALAST